MKTTILRTLTALCAAAALTLPAAAKQERWSVGSVDTAFQLLGPNHKVAVEAFRDPDFPSIVCYVSYAKAGGLSGAVGMAENPARFSLAAVKTDAAPIVPSPRQKREKQVFSSRSALTRLMHVVRFYDDETQCFIYLATSTKMLDGSPFSALAVVPLSPPSAGGAGERP